MQCWEERQRYEYLDTLESVLVRCPEALDKWCCVALSFCCVVLPCLSISWVDTCSSIGMDVVTTLTDLVRSSRGQFLHVFYSGGELSNR